MTALGILIAGGFSFYTFVLGRTFAPNVQMQFALKQVINSADGKVALVSVKVKNSGRTDVRKEDCLFYHNLAPGNPPGSLALAELERLNANDVDPLAPGMKPKNMFDDLEGLEPGEEKAEEFVVYLGQSVVFKVFGSFRTRPKLARIRIWWRNLGEKFRRPRDGKIGKVRAYSSGEIFDIREFAKEDQPETDVEPDARKTS